MATNDQAGAVTPLLVVDLHDLSHEYREKLAQTEETFRAYTADYTWNKTDIAANPAVAVGTPGRQVLAGDVHGLGGWIITETTGTAAAQFRLLDGSAVGNEVLGSGKLAQGTTQNFFSGEHGIRVYTGRIFIQVVSGSIEGVIYWR